MAQVIGILVKFVVGLAVVLTVVGAVGVVIYAGVGPLLGADFSAPSELRTETVTLAVK